MLDKILFSDYKIWTKETIKYHLFLKGCYLHYLLVINFLKRYITAKTFGGRNTNYKIKKIDEPCSF